MMQLSRLAAAAALVAGAALSSQVMAAEVCNNCDYAGEATYLGTHNALTFDSSGFRHNMLATGIFSDTWVFDFSPASFGEINANFLPSTAVTGFTIRLRSVTGPACAGSPGSLCAGLTLGADLVPPVVAGGTNAITGFSLAAGRYAFQIIGNNTAPSANTGVQYSGQIVFNPIPEPTSLALVGLALVGAAAGLRRGRKTA